ncbi:MAG: UbiA family prenyltransferase [Nanoarchaeota archaeon]|nr:UbiA family prenyltransferase [Nanoarchaeota archaeon]
MVLILIKEFLNLIRVRQWYKNLIVFMAVIFSGNILSFDLVLISFMAFVSLCLSSSATYLINDLKDLARDKIHPEKKFRPLASGKFQKWQARLLAVVFLAAGLMIAWQVNYYFFLILILLFALSQIYTFFLKKIIIADILTISSFFVIRAISGAIAIDVVISPWLILCPFFLALFLIVGKRRADLRILIKNNELHEVESKGIVTGYSLELTNSLMSISTALLVLSYSLYSFLSEYNSLMLTIPFAMYVIFHYYQLILHDSVIARQPEKIIKDKRIVIGVMLWLVITFMLIYV